MSSVGIRAKAYISHCSLHSRACCWLDATGRKPWHKADNGMGLYTFLLAPPIVRLSHNCLGDPQGQAWLGGQEPPNCHYAQLHQPGAAVQPYLENTDFVLND